MGASRTSNKDILDAINAQTAAISGLVSALSGQAAQAPAQVVTPAVETPASEPTAPTVEKRYMAHMESKVAKLTASDGEPRVLYLRKNLAGETKLAYCLQSRWASLKDNGLVGAVKIIK